MRNDPRFPDLAALIGVDEITETEALFRQFPDLGEKETA